MKTNSIGLAWITVKDFKNAVKFYTEVAGLKVAEMNEEWGWAELEGHDGSGMRLGIAQHQEGCHTDACYESPIKPGQNSVITLTIDNIEQAQKEIQKQGASLIGEIHEVPGHVKMQTVRDAEGNIFQLVEVVAHKSCHEKKSCCAH